MATSALYQQFVAGELALAPAFASRVLAGTVQLLGPARDSGFSASERSHNADLLTILQRDSAGYERTLTQALNRLVAEDLADAQGPSTAEAKTAFDGLELMDESRVEVDIEISRAMQLIDSTAEWELRELQTFTSTLLGQRHVTAESNPFRPLVYATALWEAACTVSGAPTLRAVLLRTSAGVAAGLLKNAWAAASTRLETQGVEPGTYRTVVLPSTGSFGRQAVEAPRPNAPSALLASMPQSSTGPVGAVVGAGAGQPGKDAARGARTNGLPRRNPELERALLRLDGLLRQLPAETSLPGRASPGIERNQRHRDALLATTAEPADRQVIELVTRLFDSLLGDSQLPAAIKPVFSRMQTASLRLALAEPAALDSYEHPLWQLLDRMGEASVRHSRSEDPRLSAFLAFSAAVAEEMAGAAAPDTALFRRGLNRIDVFLAEQLQAQLRAARLSVDALQLAERREVLQQNLTQRLIDQMVRIRTSPAIRRFVTGTWAQVIAVGMLRHGEQSEVTMGLLKTVDDLLWSLSIPDHPQSRQRLLTLLPGLLQRIRAGMETVSLPALERQTVLNELMTIHTEALRPGGGSGPPGALTPEEIVQRMRDEVVVETPPARSFSDSVIDLSSMETVPAEHLPTGTDGGDDDPARRIEALRVGDRQRMFLEGRWSRVQLLWRSDRSLFFLFAGESPTRTHSITRRALERLSSAGLVQPLQAKPLVQRAVERMMRDLAPRA